MATFEVDVNVKLEGLFRHYKGGYYRALHVGRLSENRGELVVVYVSLTNGNIWVRPLNTPGQDSWNDMVVNSKGDDVLRFSAVGAVGE